MNKKITVLSKKDVLIWGILVLLFVLPGIFIQRDSMLAYLTKIAILSLYALCLNLQYGYGGMGNLGSSLYFAMGGYLLMLFLTKLGMSMIVAIPLLLFIIFVFAIIFGYVLLQRGMQSFMFLSFGICILAAQFVIKTPWLGGVTGMMATVVPSWMSDMKIRYFVMLGVCLLFATILFLLTKSPMIVSLKGVRDNEERLIFLGVNVKRLRLVIFIITSVLMGISGILHTLLFNHVTPSYIEIGISLQALLMCIIGGSAVFIGPIVGCILLTTITTYLPILTPNHSLVLGVIMLICIYFIPRGLIDPKSKILLIMKNWFARINTRKNKISKIKEINLD